MAKNETGKRVGYETTGKENFDSQLDIIFDFSDLSIKTREAKQGLSDLAYELYKELAGTGRSNRSSGFISPKSVSRRQIEGVISRTIALPSEEQIYKDISRDASAVSAAGKTIMKGYANRIDTGLMNQSIYGTTKKLKYKVIAQIGWSRLWYKYFGFQENGTRSIRPMRSVMRTYLDIMPDVQKSMSFYMRNLVTGRRGSK
jgi:hypothetical protein